MRKFIFLITFFSLLACKKDPEKMSFEERVEFIKDTIPKTSVLSNDIEFINDSILKGEFRLDISKYKVKDCYPITQKKKEVYKNYENFELKNLGDLNGDGKDESVFILNPLNWCEENHGKSYYFTDNSIPRIEADSFCCELEFIFNIGDIDEDGANEIAEYKTACTSRYKSVNFWTFKNGKWKTIGTFAYLEDNGKYDLFKDFDKLFKKTDKSEFEFLEISDELANGDLVTEWKIISMK